MSAIDGTILLTNNDCYKTNKKMTPKGIVVHSTGCDNPYIKRYVQPNKYNIGTNPNSNDWNRSGLDVCVHGFLGYDQNKNIKFIQTLPFNVCCWGCGGGSKGSYNYNPPYIQFEICEDQTLGKSYCTATYNKAVEVCAYLCKTYNLSVDNIVSHNEAHYKGYASGHVDPEHWWKKHGYSMDGFRKAVKAKLNGSSSASSGTASSTSKSTAKKEKPCIKYWACCYGEWGKEVHGYGGEVGDGNHPLTAIMIKATDGKVKYRVHTKNGWLPYVTGCNMTDHKNGYAGDGTPINGIEVIYYTSDRLVKANGGYLRAVYKVAPVGKGYYTEQHDNEKSNGQDGYAGDLKNPIGKFMLTLN